MTAADDIADAFNSIPPVDATIIGTFVSQIESQAVVNVGDAQISIPNIGSTVPYPGQSVRLLRIGKQTFLWGPATPGWPIGRVTAVLSSTIATVQYPPGSAVTRDLGNPTGMTLNVGDYVLIDWTSGGLIAAGPYALASLPNVTVPVTPGGSSGGPKRQVFTALDSGSFNARWWTTDVYDSVSNDGAWFYGTKISDTIPDTATITAVSLYLPAKSTFGTAPVLRAHTSPAKPGTTVAYTGPATSLTPRTGWVSIPTTYGDLMKTGPYGLGFAANTGGYQIYSGVATDGLSGAVDISWTE